MLPNKMYAYVLLLLITLGTIFSSCRQESSLYDSFLEQNPLVKRWIDKELTFPDALGLELKSEENIKTFAKRKTPKLVIYLDAGCSSCVESIVSWLELIRELPAERFETCFILKGLKGQAEYAAVSSALDSTPHQIFADEEGAFNSLNQLPENVIYHAFLLGENNRIKIMGSPIIAPFLKEIYASEVKKL